MNKAQIKATIKQLVNNKWLNRTIKGLMLLALGWTLHSQIIARDNIDAIWAEFIGQLSPDNWYLLALVLVLMPFSWSIEAIKWQKLVHYVEVVPFWKAFQAIFAGITISVFTPNRIGEYGGRILLVKPENKVQVIIATLVGSLSQLVVLLSVGFCGLVYFISWQMNPDIWLLYALIFGLILSILLMFFCYLNIDLVIPLFRKIPVLRRATLYINVVSKYSSRELIVVLLYSLGRYSVYSFQYYLLLQFFGIDVPFFEALASIALIFLLQTSIPLPPLMGLLVRGQVALYVWKFFTLNEIAILSTTFGLWFINIIIAALIGTIFILNINVLKSFGYDKTNN